MEVSFSLRQNTAMAKYILAGLFSLCALCGLCGQFQAGQPVSRFTFNEPHMGTRFKIIVCAPDEAAAKSAVKAAFQRIAGLDGIMSDYRSTSELMRLCLK